MTRNFPTSPSNGQTYEYNNITYTFDGVKWGGSASTGSPAAPASDLVIRAGDTMTGDLKINNGSNDTVVLNTDGSASFEGKVTSAETGIYDSSTTLTTKSYVNEATLNVAEVVHRGNQLIAQEVIDGTVLYLDASNYMSYPGGGPIWFDLSGNKHHATVHGDDFWSSEDGGKFDWGDQGTISHIQLPHEAARDVGSSWTLEFVMKPRVTDTPKYFMSIATAEDTNHMLLRVKDGGISGWGSYDGFEVNDDEIIHFAITGSDDENGHFYKNGSDEGTSTHVRQINEVADQGWVLNQDQDTIGGGFQDHQNYRGGFMIIKLYNRILDPREIRQNSDVLLARYTP